MEITKDMVNWEKYLSDHPKAKSRSSMDVWDIECEALNHDEYAINERFALYLTDEAKAAVIKEYAPETCYLYYVDYRDDFEHHIDKLESSVQKNSLLPLSEFVYDLWDCPEAYELGEIEKEMTGDGLKELFDELYDEFKEWLCEHDKSEPVKDLLRNTGDMVYFYSLGEEIEGWPEPAFLCESHRITEESEEVAKILKVLNLPADHPSVGAIEIMVAQASYGGDLRIYFSAGVEDLIADPKYDNDSEDFKSIHIKGDVCICIANPWNGSGDMCDVKGVDVILPFDRDNLHLSQIEKYSAEEIYGMRGNWTREYDAPTFSMEAAPEGATIAKSSTNADLAQEAEYNRVFQAGSCTYGDRDMNRHRNVYYRNEIPCGCVCPHCGTFWVD